MEYKSKIALIGNEKTGKTSLILRYLNNSFSQQYITTLGADFVDKTYSNKEIPKLGQNSLNIVIWDMAGQSHFSEIALIYCDGSAGMIIVFDVNDKESFASLPKWVKFSNKVCPDAIKLIIGNKTDLKQEVSDSDIKKFEKKYGIPIKLASAKLELENENSNVTDIFLQIASDLVDKYIFD